MNELVKKETLTTRQIAKIIRKRHSDILKLVRKKLENQIEGVIKVNYVNNQNHQTYQEYVLTMDALCVLNQWYRNKDLGDICGQKVLMHTTRFEVSFGNILIPILKELGLEVERQFVVGSYRIDFYIPKLKVAIEYDEFQHNHMKNILNDKQREDYLRRVLGCRFVRVSFKEDDAKNVGKVLSQIVKVK